MSIQSQSEASAELQEWYTARKNAAQGKSHTFTTAEGTQTVTMYDMDEINDAIQRLERRVSVPDGTQRHAFLVGNCSRINRG